MSRRLARVARSSARALERARGGDANAARALTTTTATTATTRARATRDGDSATARLLREDERARIARDLRAMATRKLDGDASAHGRRVALVPLGTYNEDPCVVVTVSEDMMRRGRACALPSAAVEEWTLLESASVATTSAAKRAKEALFGKDDKTVVEMLGATHDVLDVRGRTVVTPVLAYMGEIGEKVRGRSDVAAISLSTLMSLDGVAPDAKNGGVRFIGTLAAAGLEGYEAAALHAALRVVAGPRLEYKEALYDQFVAGYKRRAPPAPPGAKPSTPEDDRATG